MTSCGYLRFLSSFYFILPSSLLSLLSWTFYTSIIVITTNSWTYSIDSQSDRVSGEYLLGWDFVVAGSRVDLSDLDQHRYGDDIYVYYDEVSVCVFVSKNHHFLYRRPVCLLVYVFILTSLKVESRK